MGGSAVVLTLSAWACSSIDDNEATTRGAGSADRCTPPQQGCPCTDPGLERECGKVKERYDDYVACSMGKQRCEGGFWGECKGDSVAYKSIRPVGSVHTLALGDAGACVALNLCDPACFSFENDNSLGIDSGPDSALVATDAGGFSLSGVKLACIGLQCNVAVSCTPGNETRITGVVRDPAGQNPVYNALVYIPNSPTSPLPLIPDGAFPDTCGGAGTLPPSVAYAFTKPDGSFTMTNVPNGVPMRIVIQTGKWRRDFMYTIPTACTATSFEATPALKDLMRLPRTHQRPTSKGVAASITGEGHLPKIAIVTGNADGSMPCMIKRMGVDLSEFGNYNQAGGTPIPYIERRMHLYRGNGNTAAFNTPPRGELLSNTGVNTTNPARVRGYDIALLPCNGGAEYNGTTLAERQSLIDYANVGGRVETSHWGREWVEHAPAASQWPATVGGWSGGSGGSNGYPAKPPTNPNGLAFEQWLIASGAITGNGLTGPRYLVMSGAISGIPWVNAATARLWVYGSGTQVNFPSAQPPPSSPTNPQMVTDYTFDTPIGAGPKYGRVMFANMHLTAPSGSGTGVFPGICNASPTLSPQEKAMEFLLNDLGACVNNLPPSGVLYNNAATFTRDYFASCAGSGTAPVWHLFQWQSITPSDSNIVFTARTATSAPGLDAADPASLAIAQGPPTAGWVAVDVESKLRADVPPQMSKAFLRVDMTLNPSTDKFFSPALLGWRIGYSCAASE